MKEILKYSYDPFYTDLISFFVAVVGLIISIWKYKQKPQLKPLFFFFLGYVLDMLINHVIIEGTTLTIRYHYLIFYSDFFDTIIEFLAFFFLIKNHIVNLKIKKLLNPLLPLFLCALAIDFIFYKITYPEIGQYFLQTIFTIQALVLIIACILYYVDLFQKEPNLNLANQPSFWVVTGLSFFMVCTLPFSIFGSYLIKTNYRLYFQLFGIFNIFYCLLFIMIIRAYLCKPLVGDNSM